MASINGTQERRDPHPGESMFQCHLRRDRPGTGSDVHDEREVYIAYCARSGHRECEQRLRFQRRACKDENCRRWLDAETVAFQSHRRLFAPARTHTHAHTHTHTHIRSHAHLTSVTIQVNDNAKKTWRKQERFILYTKYCVNVRDAWKFQAVVTFAPGPGPNTFIDSVMPGRSGLL